MNSSLYSFWNRIVKHGFQSNMGISQKRYIYLLNVHWLITLLCFVVYFIISLVIAKHAIVGLLVTNAFFFTFLISTRFFIQAGFYKVAKHILLILINVGIFLYDNYFGGQHFVALYYIPFLFVTINICIYQLKWVTLAAYFLLPIVLFSISKETDYSIFAVANQAAVDGTFVQYFNFAACVVLVGIFATNVIKGYFDNLSALDQAKLNLQSLIDNTADSIWSIDKKNILTAANKTFKQDMLNFFGIEVKNGFNLEGFNNGAQFPELFKAHQRKLQADGYIYDEYVYNDQWYELIGSTYKDDLGVNTGASFYARNITQRKLYEDQLQHAQYNIQALIDNSLDSIWSVAIDYKIIAANSVFLESMSRLFGVEVKAGFNVHSVFEHPAHPKEWEMHYASIFKGESLTFEYEFHGMFYELRAKPITNDQGRVLGGAFYARDISRRKQNELELIKAKENAEEASKAKARFLSNMSHELRTPLNGIIGITNILMNEEMLPNQKEHLAILKFSGDHMLSLVDDVLDFNKIEAGKIELDVEHFNLKELVEKTAATFYALADQKQLDFTIDIEDVLNKPMIGDATRLKQVLQNLLGNAFKFTLKGGVTLTVKTIPGNTVNHFVSFIVRDTGIGISNSKQHKIFESFTQADTKTTRNFGGSGLGLTISKELVELMDGHIVLDSKEGEGTVFTVQIPLPFASEQQLKITNEKNITELKQFHNYKVLLAEDNPVNLMVANNILKKWSLETESAVNGAIAIELAKTNKYDLILMDLEMPVVDGTTAVREIRSFNTKVPIIAFTAANYANMLADLKAKGMNDYVRKPFKPEELHQKIAQLLNV
jgi:signal transduction histidine kinase